MNNESSHGRWEVQIPEVVPLPVPNRSRNQDGRFRKKRNDTDADTLEEIYGKAIPNSPPNKHLKTILEDTGQPSLSQLVNDPKKER